MSNPDQKSHKDLSEKIQKIFHELADGDFKQLHGVFYKAVKAIADQAGINAELYLNEYQIKSDDIIGITLNRLKSLGFPASYTDPIEKREGVVRLTSEEVRRHRILLAATLLLLCSNEDLFSGPSDNPQMEKSQIEEFVLGLVLKAKDLGDLEESSRPGKELIQEKLSLAHYFICLLKKDMEEVTQKIDLDDSQIDKNSYNYVLVGIEFRGKKWTGDKPIKTKLVLQQYLNQISSGFKVKTIKNLNRVYGLSEHDFTRA